MLSVEHRHQPKQMCHKNSNTPTDR